MEFIDLYIKVIAKVFWIYQQTQQVSYEFTSNCSKLMLSNTVAGHVCPLGESLSSLMSKYIPEALTKPDKSVGLHLHDLSF